MPVLIQYILKLSLSVAIIHAFYYLVLRRLTFYNLNRWYLLGYTLMCFIIPFINIAQIAQKADNAMPVISYIPVVQNIKGYLPNVATTEPAYTFSAWDVAMGILFVGSAILLVRLIMQFISFYRLKNKAEIMSDTDATIYHVDEPIMPFSFGRSIYINKTMHTDSELKEIIMHEYVHVKQAHSADILIAELFCAINWYNPFAWFIRHSIKQNLEFIADDNVVRAGLDKKAYQYHLLKVVGIPQYRIANQFNFSSLKKRIIMMNREKSAKIHLLKFMFILPLLAVTLLAFRSEIAKAASSPKAIFAKIKPAIKVIPATTNEVITAPASVKPASKPATGRDSTVKNRTNVLAQFAGEVVKTVEGSGTYMVIIRNDDSYAAYSNLVSASVNKGDKVTTGQVIGTVANDPATGRSNLRLELYSGSQIVADNATMTNDSSKTINSVTFNGVPVVMVTGHGIATNGNSSRPVTVNGRSIAATRSSTRPVVTVNGRSVSGTGNTTGTVVNVTGYSIGATGSSPGSAYSTSSQSYANTTYSGKPLSYTISSDPHVVMGTVITDSMGDAPIPHTGYAIAPGPDEMDFVIDPARVNDVQIKSIEKQFADAGFELKISPKYKDSKLYKLNITISGKTDNSSASAEASYAIDDMQAARKLIKISGDKKTKLVSLGTFPTVMYRMMSPRK